VENSVALTRSEVKARIEEIGIVPGIRTSSAEEARFAAETVASAGIPIVEITMTIPGALEVIAHLAEHTPGVIIGAGTVLDTDTAHQCLKAGAHFLTGPGLDLATIQLAHNHDVTILAGALTPTEVIAAWKAGADFVKVFPCAPVGGDAYIRALKGPFPKIPLIAAGGVNQTTATNFILAGASALGIGSELIPRQAIQKRQAEQIRELAKRFLRLVAAARARLAPRPEVIFTHH
jgi:2-dehydro-3-deoxyphosphogluconate aldolase/(4S)-4-hydroxy-2-oxoglutarate aldolase